MVGESLREDSTRESDWAKALSCTGQDRLRRRHKISGKVKEESHPRGSGWLVRGYLTCEGKGVGREKRPADTRLDRGNAWSRVGKIGLPANQPAPADGEDREAGSKPTPATGHPADAS